MYASWNNHFEIVQFLIQCGANKNARDNQGSTALKYSKGKAKEYLRSLGY